MAKSAHATKPVRISFRDCIHFEVTLRRDSECVCHAIEESKHGGDVDGLGDLRLGPAMIAKQLHVFCCRTIGRLSHLGYIIQQGAIGRGQFRLIEFAAGQSLDSFFFCSLNTQEVSMRVQSIGASVEP